MANSTVGLDFGSNNCKLAHLVEGYVEVQENNESKRSTPSCVIVPDGLTVLDWIFGESAVLHSFLHPDRAVYCAKDLLGTAATGSAIELSFVEQVVRNILQNVIATHKGATSTLPSRAVISIPAYFTEDQRKGLVRAAFHLFLDEIVLIDDVAAAMAAYLATKNLKETVVVLDVGAGGTTVGVARLQNSIVNILNISQMRLPGGEMFSQRLIEYIKKTFYEETGLVFSHCNSRDSLIIKELAESTKQKLSKMVQTSVQAFLPEMQYGIHQMITRSDFETLCQDLFQSIVDEAKQIVTESYVEKVDAIVIVGGSARVPVLKSLLEENFRCKVNLFDPDEAVVKGLVLVGNRVVNLIHHTEKYQGYSIVMSPIQSQLIELPESNTSSIIDVESTDTPEEIYIKDQIPVLPLLPNGLNVDSEDSDQIPVLPSLPNGLNVDSEDSDQIHEPHLSPNGLNVDSEDSDQIPVLPLLPNGPNVDSKDSDQIHEPHLSPNGLNVDSENSDQIHEPHLSPNGPKVDSEDTGKDGVSNNDASTHFTLPLKTSEPTNMANDSADDEEDDALSGKKQFALDLNEALTFKKGGGYPERLRGKNNNGKRANFRKQCRPFFVDTSGKFWYKKPQKEKITNERDTSNVREVILDKEEQARLIMEYHQGANSTLEATAMSGHRGRDRLVAALSIKYFWQNMYIQAERFCQLCLVCKAVNPASLKVSDPMHPVGVPARHMAQLGIDLSQMPVVDGKKYIIVVIDYFTKWIEAGAIPDKTMGTVFKFLYEEVVCRHGCPEYFITDQGRELRNILSRLFEQFTKSKQRVTSPYHPQANGLVERANRSIKNTLLKVLGTRVDKWPSCLPGVIFALRTSLQSSTKFSPFYLMYGRHPKLPADLPKKHEDDSQSDSDNSEREDDPDPKAEWVLSKEPQDEDDEEDIPIIDMAELMKQMDGFREKVDKAVADNIKAAQDRQKRGYDKRHTGGQVLSVGDEVFRVNQRRRDRKGGKYEMPKYGPYTIVAISDRKTVTLKSVSGKVLQTKYPLKDLVPVKIPDPHQQKRGERPKDDTANDVIVISDGEDVYQLPKMKEPCFVPLEELADFAKLPEETLILTSRHFTLSAGEIKILFSTEWLNDEIINAYLSTICKDRSTNGNDCYYLNSFFYRDLAISFDKALKWMKSLDIFEAHFILIPIHLGDHWAICIVDNKQSSVSYYDSGSRVGKSHLEKVGNFLQWIAQRNNVESFSPYKLVDVRGIALQSNSYDCGVYTCFYARRVTGAQGCQCSPGDITRLRAQIAQEILAGKLLGDSFLEESAKPLPKQPKPETPGKGLVNLGNTCYINSCLQALFHIEDFVLWLNGQEEHLSECANPFCLTCSLYQVHKETLANDKTPLAPEHFVHCVQDFWEDFKPGKMQDAHEFLGAFMQNLDREYLESYDNSQKSFKGVLSPCSPFSLEVLITTKCKCGETSEVVAKENSLVISMEEKHVKTLDIALGNYTKEEIVTKKCSTCHKTQARKTTVIRTPPEVLTVVVSRYSTSGRKITRGLQSPSILDIRPYMATEEEQGPCMYDLLGVVTHIGNSRHSGHYTATFKSGKHFFLFNDEQVTFIPDGELDTSRSYILFYKKT